MDRAKAYCIVRDLLSPGPVSVIEFGCRDGRGRLYLGRAVSRYLGLERSRGGAAAGVDVRRGFDYSERTDIPRGFDVGICLSIPRDLRPGAVVWTVGQAVKEGGSVFIGVKLPGDAERLKKLFRTVGVWQSGGVALAECRGLKTAKEIAA
jgi:hypothetical protein